MKSKNQYMLMALAKFVQKRDHDPPVKYKNVSHSF